MRLAFDIESNGLNEVTIDKKGNAVPEGTKVWCLVAQDIDTGNVWSFTENDIAMGVELLRTANLIVGHNIAMFDIPFLERLYGPINTPVMDTLIVSKLMYPDRQDHPLGGNSLECWGKHLGVEKIDFSDDWSSFTDDMLTYCQQDVKVSINIFKAQQEFVKKYPKSVKLEHMVSRIISNQICNGIGFNIDAADQLEQDLFMEKVLIEDEMSQIFPPIVEERWSDKTGKKLKDRIIHFNPASRKQIAGRLKAKYNWNPPKTEKGNPKVDSAVLKELSYPEAKSLVRYFDIQKLLGMVSDWINRARTSRDGRIHGSVNPQGTVTGRMTASQPNLQQVSSDPRSRELFIPRDGWVQVGVDASGLEARLLANRMAPWDNGAYGRDVVEGDIHKTNMEATGIQERAVVKTFFYGFIYGAGDAKVGKIIGKNAKAGKELKEKFLTSMPALKELIENVKFQVAKKGTITLLDQREVPCRAAHKALNVQLQGDGAILMKLAQCLFNAELNKMFKGKFAFMATVHDEWQIECDSAIAKEVGELGKRCIIESGKRLNCLVPMDGDYRIGRNWSECH